jgi:DNA-binding LytR/AlgR family response regulator
MKAIIIEDEKLSAEHLTRLLKKLDSPIEIIARFDSVKKCVEEFKKGVKADLLFVDVHLADGISFEIFSQVRVESPIIFTTAFDEYAIKAFKLNSIDYLLKPIGMADLKAAIEKFNKLNRSAPGEILGNLSDIYQNLNKQFKNRFMVKTGDTISSIKSEEISHFISEDGAVLLVTDNKRYVVDYTLDTIETLISPALFFRINRKVIVNISSVKKVSAYFNSRLKLDSAHLTPEDCIVSRERVNDFKQWLDK